MTVLIRGQCLYVSACLQLRSLHLDRICHFLYLSNPNSLLKIQLRRCALCEVFCCSTVKSEILSFLWADSMYNTNVTLCPLDFIYTFIFELPNRLYETLKVKPLLTSLFIPEYSTVGSTKTDGQGTSYVQRNKWSARFVNHLYLQRNKKMNTDFVF